MQKKLELKNIPNNNGRLYFGKLKVTDVPDLCKIQTESFAYFKERGVRECLDDFFPVSNENPKTKQVDKEKYVELDWVDLEWRQPSDSIADCLTKDKTYQASLYVKCQLKKPDGTISENKIFMGEYPMMTPTGTFIINGSERVIVSQIVRSPGAYIAKVIQPKTGESIYEADIIPARGTWLEFMTDNKNSLLCRIDKQKKVSALTLLRAIGFNKDSYFQEVFGSDIQFLTNAIDENPALDVSDGENVRFMDEEKVTNSALHEIFTKLRPGEPSTKESELRNLQQKFFDKKHYDLGPAGRGKLKDKLGIYQRLVGTYLAEDLISAEGEILHEAGEYMSKEVVDKLRKEEVFENGACLFKFNCNAKLEDNPHNTVNRIEVRKTDDINDKKLVIVGTDLTIKEDYITQSDIVALFSYFLNVIEGLGDIDDIDHLGNRRVKCVGELIQNVFRQGLTKMEKGIKDKMSSTDIQNLSVNNIMNIKSIEQAVKTFFNSSQLSQIMDQTNPLAELTNKRRISALGPGGIQRDRASMEVRDVHYTHYGRICPIETPEGQNIGLISNLACYAEVNDKGFIETPYRKVDRKTHKVTDQIDRLSADKERNHYIAQAGVEINEDGTIKGDANGRVVCRHNGENVLVEVGNVDYIDVSPKQIVSIATACIPFLENDDIHRAMMGANMQRQALSLIKPTVPYVGTGLERTIAKDSGAALLSPCDGVVKYVDAKVIKIEPTDKKSKKNLEEIKLIKFQRSNQGTCINQKPIVKVGQKVSVGDIIADGPAMVDGELALGQNVLIAFMNWHGYNFEDAVIMSERLVKEDVYTSIHIEEHQTDLRRTKLGDESFTRDVPNVKDEDKQFLSKWGVIAIGSEVKENAILVGKVTPKGEQSQLAADKLLKAIFQEKSKEGKDASLRIPHGGAGIVIRIKWFIRKTKSKNVDIDLDDELEGEEHEEVQPKKKTKSSTTKKSSKAISYENRIQELKDAGIEIIETDALPNGVQERVVVYVAQKRKISEGDKMSGRHGNKGVISKIMPVEDMPFLPNGRPVDIMLSPLGVPSRMNIGQILEVHLGYACSKLGIKIATPVFDGVTNDELTQLMEMAGIDKDGKSILYDGITGERYDNRINVGIMYMIKLVHMVDDKLHARATGPYSLVTQQPLGGKAQNGGQRFGEMEVWALEAYGAAYTLQEMLTIKSDDMVGRNKAYEAILSGTKIPKPNMPESFRVLIKELQGLAINVKLSDNDGKQIDTNDLTTDIEKEKKKSQQNVNKINSSDDSSSKKTI